MDETTSRDVSDESQPVEAEDAPAPKPPRPRFKPCRIRGCDEPGKHRETGYCVAHAGRYIKAKRAGAV